MFDERTTCLVSHLKEERNTSHEEKFMLTLHSHYSQKQFTIAAGDQAYTDSGAELQPFIADQLRQRGTSQISSRTTSAEEFPWRTILLQDNEFRYLGPATLSQQRCMLATLQTPHKWENTDMRE